MTPPQLLASRRGCWGGMSKALRSGSAHTHCFCTPNLQRPDGLSDICPIRPSRSIRAAQATTMGAWRAAWLRRSGAKRLACGCAHVGGRAALWPTGRRPTCSEQPPGVGHQPPSPSAATGPVHPQVGPEMGGARGSANADCGVARAFSHEGARAMACRWGLDASGGPGCFWE